MNYPHIFGEPLLYVGGTRSTCRCCGTTRVDWDGGPTEWLAAGSEDRWNRPGEPPCREGATARRRAAEVMREAERLNEAERDLNRLETIAGGTTR